MATKIDDRLDIMYAQISVLAIIESMKLSLDELKKSDKPSAKSYIDGMTKYVQKMNEVYITLKSMEEEIKILGRMNFNFQKEVMDLKFKIKDLETEKKMNEI
jgi:predicted RNase H-like nuclease (RuvC/YqgF family)